MTEIRFYHLQQQSLDQALPLLLRKALDSGKRIYVRMKDDSRLNDLSDALWSYRDNGFLPHGLENEKYSEDQPVLIGHEGVISNKADMLVLTNGAEHDKLDDFTLCCEMFNGQNQDEVTAARARWKAYKETGHTLTYWQQNERGGWEQKA